MKDASAINTDQNSFKSWLQNKWQKIEKYYLPEQFDSGSKQGQKEVSTYVINLIDGTGGGL
jgi:hypothetical protein